jgi:hypothetical protein
MEVGLNISISIKNPVICEFLGSRTNGIRPRKLLRVSQFALGRIALLALLATISSQTSNATRATLERTVNIRADDRAQILADGVDLGTAHSFCFQPDAR